MPKCLNRVKSFVVCPWTHHTLNPSASPTDIDLVNRLGPQFVVTIVSTNCVYTDLRHVLTAFHQRVQLEQPEAWFFDVKYPNGKYVTDDGPLGILEGINLRNRIGFSASVIQASTGISIMSNELSEQVP